MFPRVIHPDGAEEFHELYLPDRLRYWCPEHGDLATEEAGPHNFAPCSLLLTWDRVRASLHSPEATAAALDDLSDYGDMPRPFLTEGWTALFRIVEKWGLPTFPLMGAPIAFQEWRSIVTLCWPTQLSWEGHHLMTDPAMERALCDLVGAPRLVWNDGDLRVHFVADGLRAVVAAHVLSKAITSNLPHVGPIPRRCAVCDVELDGTQSGKFCGNACRRVARLRSNRASWHRNKAKWRVS